MAGSSPGPVELRCYDSIDELHGLLYHLGTRGGTQPWQNPCEAGLVSITCSSLSPHSPPCSAMANRDGLACSTQNETQPRFLIDLHRACFRLSHYTLDVRLTFAPRHWKLEGSSDGERWDLLDEHNNDDSLHKSVKGPRSWRCTSTVQLSDNTQDRWYRLFRLHQIGANSGGEHRFHLCAIELYGSLLTPPE